jgi:hypothetical protein
MRKLILISAFVLASVSAQAGQGRSLILAANDEPKAIEKVETTKPEEAKSEAVKSEAVKSEAVKPEAANADVKADDAAKPESSKRHASRPAKKSYARNYEADEAKARRIAAKYGVYW